ncbi:hypothetical protein ZWY2020_024398 [Hordeum vulgare]|nr:hypothetical protein ZWY2020_024398 [Hordeum vulgare]
MGSKHEVSKESAEMSDFFTRIEMEAFDIARVVSSCPEILGAGSCQSAATVLSTMNLSAEKLCPPPSMSTRTEQGQDLMVPAEAREGVQEGRGRRLVLASREHVDRRPAPGRTGKMRSASQGQHGGRQGAHEGRDYQIRTTPRN